MGKNRWSAIKTIWLPVRSLSHALAVRKGNVDSNNNILFKQNENKKIMINGSQSNVSNI